MSYLSVETEQKPQDNWIVAYDLDTVTILNSNPTALLNKVFQDDPNNLFLLKKTGFSMSIQIQTWINLYNKAIEENGDLNEVTEQLISKTIQDVMGFYFEYLTGQDIFPIKVELIETISGEKTVYASRYNQTLESLALPTEREGALTEGVKKAVEILVNAEPETIVFLTSPKGKSGLGHDHSDNQTYVYWINSDGDLDALTIRTDIDLVASEKLVDIKNNNVISTWDRIKKIVSSPKNINANDFEAVLDLIEEASGQTFEKQRREIKNRQELFTLNEKASAIIEDLKNYLTANISQLDEPTIRIFVLGVGKAVLDLAKQTLQPKATVVYSFDNYQPRFMNYQDQYAEYGSIYQQVQAIPGCNGGGMMGGGITNSFGFAQMQIEDGGKTCQKCGTSEGVACGWCKPCWKIFGNG